MKIYSGKKSIEVRVRNLGFWGKGIGLMFRTRETGNLLFDFGSDGRAAIHSYFVFFDFLALWLDSENRIVEWQIVKPFTFRIMPSEKFRRLIEIPVNARNKKIIGFFVGKNN